MTCPYLCYTKTAAGWEFTGRDDKPVPLEVVDAFIKSVGGAGGYLIPPEYLREHPELVKGEAAAGGSFGGEYVEKADRGVGGSVPPRSEPDPQPKPKFDPVARSPYDPLLHSRPKPEKPERPFMPRQEYINLNRSR